MNTDNQNNQRFILLVEDDSFISGMYYTKLSSLGFKVELVEDGEEAWKRLQENPMPDMVLLDVVLPKKDGFEILAGLRKDGRTKSLPVILLTNLGQKPDVERGERLGADDYIIKAHFTPTEVVDKIVKILGKKQEARSKKHELRE